MLRLFWFWVIVRLAFFVSAFSLGHEVGVGALAPVGFVYVAFGLFSEEAVGFLEVGHGCFCAAAEHFGGVEFGYALQHVEAGVISIQFFCFGYVVVKYLAVLLPTLLWLYGHASVGYLGG